MATKKKYQHGGARPGAGRKPNIPGQPGVPHLPRAELSGRHPVLVRQRLHPELPDLRRHAGLRSIFLDAVRAGNQRDGFRVCHFGIVGDHLHLIVEADDADRLARGIQGLGVRLSRRLNGALGRSGRFFSDRYLAQALRTPAETHRALAVVLLGGVDAWSSGPWWDGWADGPAAAKRRRLQKGAENPVVAPRTALLRDGWRKAGSIASGGVAPEPLPRPTPPRSRRAAPRRARSPGPAARRASA
jgi:hypothetical protein